ncbi:hypothetical protein K4L44_01605 [Halosquirtibacter laminarini]|uniref:Uncharacterized protein n=1 Tax=Halosquirtibacter laminarini TaxID=3374600 RepID=A0AC61NG30_9BACT|nr:hypothetical protein K4L44_01605 [Prolixibacteraceae bacterium]
MNKLVLIFSFLIVAIGCTKNDDSVGPVIDSNKNTGSLQFDEVDKQLIKTTLDHAYHYIDGDKEMYILTNYDYTSMNERLTSNHLLQVVISGTREDESTSYHKVEMISKGDKKELTASYYPVLDQGFWSAKYSCNSTVFTSTSNEVNDEITYQSFGFEFESATCETYFQKKMVDITIDYKGKVIELSPNQCPKTDVQEAMVGNPLFSVKGDAKIKDFVLWDYYYLGLSHHEGQNGTSQIDLVNFDNQGHVVETIPSLGNVGRGHFGMDIGKLWIGLYKGPSFIWREWNQTKKSFEDTPAFWFIGSKFEKISDEKFYTIGSNIISLYSGTDVVSHSFDNFSDNVLFVYRDLAWSLIEEAGYYYLVGFNDKLEYKRSVVLTGIDKSGMSDFKIESIRPDNKGALIALDNHNNFYPISVDKF